MLFIKLYNRISMFSIERSHHTLRTNPELYRLPDVCRVFHITNSIAGKGDASIVSRAYNTSKARNFNYKNQNGNEIAATDDFSFIPSVWNHCGIEFPDYALDFPSNNRSKLPINQQDFVVLVNRALGNC